MLVKRLTPTAKLPTKAYSGDAGWDLYADVTEAITIPPQSRKLIPTGCSFSIPYGYYGRIADRSSVAWKSGGHVLAGVVDSSYRGEVKIVLMNLSDTDIVISPGDKISQMVVTQIYTGNLTEVEELENTVRGEGGFGSSGK
jgi:dUTP pyrophosphatase